MATMQNSLRLGRMFGIDVGVHWTWLLIFGLVTFTLATGYFPSVAPGQTATTFWIMGAVAAILLFLSVLVHELAHSLVAQAQDMSVDGITLFLFGGVSNIQERPPDPKSEFFVSVVGPLTSLGLGAIFLILDGTLALGAVVGATIAYLGAINLALGLFNLIPGFPLDGGRVLRAAVWGITDDRAKATRIASMVGVGIAWLFIIGGIALAVFTGDVIGGIWLAFIGWFLLQSAGSRYQQTTEQMERGRA